MEKFFYRVCEEDKLLSIAEKFSIPITKLIADNNLKREVCLGDMLYIEKPDGLIYKVDARDSLFSISERFKVPEQKILSDNGIPYVFYGLNLIIKKGN